MRHVLIPVDKIRPNPHRDFKRNPIREDQVAKIVESIGRTGFWDNVVVRPHPELKGEYQLAYGHSRLEAVRQIGDITEVRLPVADLSDWDMHCAMVDENETQQEVTPAVAFENVESGVELIERGFRAIGPEGTEEEFNKVIGRSSVSVDTLEPEYFRRVLNAFHAGEGIGRNFVEGFLPCGRLRSNALSAILSARYGKLREEAKTKQAAAKEKEAEAKADAARASEDVEEQKRLIEESTRAEAEAKKLRAEARRIGEGAVSENILLSFKTTRQMTDFAAAVKANSVPPAKHKALAKHIQDNDLIGKQMAEGARKWWYVESGQQTRDIERMKHASAMKSFERYYRDGDLGQFLLRVGSDARELTRDLEKAADPARYHENQKHRDILRRDLEKLVAAAEKMIQSLTGPAVRFDAEPQTKAVPLLNGR